MGFDFESLHTYRKPFFFFSPDLYGVYKIIVLVSLLCFPRSLIDLFVLVTSPLTITCGLYTRADSQRGERNGIIILSEKAQESFSLLKHQLSLKTRKKEKKKNTRKKTPTC